MKALVVRQDSLLWHLVTNYSSVSKYDKVTDLCTITSATIKSIFMVCLIVLIGTGLLIPVIWIVLPIFNLLFGSAPAYFPDLFFIGLGGYGVIAVTIAIQSYRYSERNSKPTVIGEAWRSFKEKSCIRVVVE